MTVHLIDALHKGFIEDDGKERLTVVPARSGVLTLRGKSASFAPRGEDGLPQGEDGLPRDGVYLGEFVTDDGDRVPLGKVSVQNGKIVADGVREEITADQWHLLDALLSRTAALEKRAAALERAVRYDSLDFLTWREEEKKNGANARAGRKDRS